MRKIIIIGVSVIFCVFLAFLIITPIANDNIAKKTAEGLSDLPIPQNTECIETVYRAGKLVGNGNGMQYFGAILIQSELSLNELEEFYSNRSNCGVKQQTTSEIGIIEHGNLEFKTDITGENYYIIYSWGTNSIPSLQNTFLLNIFELSEEK